MIKRHEVAGFASKHPWMTFILAIVGISTIAEVAVAATGKKPTTSQPVSTGGGAA